MSGSNAPFKPFQSGCSLCKPSTDYTNYYQNAGGNYSKQGLIPRQPSSSANLLNNGYDNVGTNGSTVNMMSNYGKSYQTTGGKKKKPKRFRYDGFTLIKKLRKIIVKIAIERNSNKLNGTRLFNFPKVTIKKNFG